MEAREGGFCKVDSTTPELPPGRFLLEFFIEHHRDTNIDICSRQYWLEYHKSNPHKTLSVNYHILQPSQYSLEIAKSKQLVPYRELVNLDDILGVSLHGPFNFATPNNRKTKDIISAADWFALADQSAHDQNQAPKVSSRVIHINVTQPNFENISTDPEVQGQCQVFMQKLEFTDETLQDYGCKPN
jgi:hypothetical protein